MVPSDTFSSTFSFTIPATAIYVLSPLDPDSPPYTLFQSSSSQFLRFSVSHKHPADSDHDAALEKMLNSSFHVCPKFQLRSRLQVPTCRPHARLVHATGGPLPARGSRGPAAA